MPSIFLRLCHTIAGHKPSSTRLQEQPWAGGLISLMMSWHKGWRMSNRGRRDGSLVKNWGSDPSTMGQVACPCLSGHFPYSLRKIYMDPLRHPIKGRHFLVCFRGAFYLAWSCLATLSYEHISFCLSAQPHRMHLNFKLLTATSSLCHTRDGLCRLGIQVGRVCNEV